MLERISGLQEVSTRFASAEAAYRPSQTSRVMANWNAMRNTFRKPGIAHGRLETARYTPAAVHMRCTGTAKLRSRMGVPLKCQLRFCRAGKPLRVSQRRTSHAASRMSRAHTTRAAKASHPSRNTVPSSKERSRIEKIMGTS